jgi:asparagine synthase (glutamine-hydrolysing)
MCGIAGFIDSNERTQKPVLEAMTLTLKHRGPEYGRCEVFNDAGASVGLGHRRLSIIDLSDAGRQPMHHNDLTITFNGEIYKYKELQAELVSMGCVFKGNSDTEVILQSYEKWGRDCLKKFIGMFAFVIYDRKNQVVFCARDRAGVKPLFYYWRKGLFLFSS